MHQRILQAFPIILAMGLALLRTPAVLAAALPDDTVIQGAVGRVFSAGNSVRGRRAIADISSALGGNPYAVRPR